MTEVDDARHAGTASLVAIRCRPADAGPVLQRVWSVGDAALLLPVDAPDGVIAEILTTQRPARLLDLAADPHAGAHHLDGSRGVAAGVALVVTTSGSTGRPKGVELTHSALQASTRASLERLGARPGERFALVLPTHHVAGVQVLLRSWALGTDAEVVDDLTGLATSDATHVSLVPTQLARALDADIDLSRFATVLLGGARPEPQLLSRARAAGVHVIVSYGMTETCGGCVYDGVPLRDVEMEVTAGRIRLRGPMLFGGYRDDAAATRAVVDDRGWFTTGDLGQIVDGRLEVLGRADDTIISGGENVPRAAVEAAVRSVPGVAEVAVVGRPDADWGQLVVAVVVTHHHAQPPTLEEVRAHVRATHPAAYAPRAMVLVDALPRDQMGKLRRDDLLRIAVAG